MNKSEEGGQIIFRPNIYKAGILYGDNKAKVIDGKRGSIVYAKELPTEDAPTLGTIVRWDPETFQKAMDSLGVNQENIGAYALARMSGKLAEEIAGEGSFKNPRITAALDSGMSLFYSEHDIKVFDTLGSLRAGEPFFLTAEPFHNIREKNLPTRSVLTAHTVVTAVSTEGKKLYEVGIGLMGYKDNTT